MPGVINGWVALWLLVGSPSYGVVDSGDGDDESMMFVGGESGAITGRSGSNGGSESAPRRSRRLDVSGVLCLLALR